MKSCMEEGQICHGVRYRFALRVTSAGSTHSQGGATSRVDRLSRDSKAHCGYTAQPRRRQCEIRLAESMPALLFRQKVR